MGRVPRGGAGLRVSTDLAMSLGMLETLASIPMGVWKRVAVYPLLGVVLGQGCGCQRPSPLMNALLVAVALLGIAGAVACLHGERAGRGAS